MGTMFTEMPELLAELKVNVLHAVKGLEDNARCVDVAKLTDTNTGFSKGNSILTHVLLKQLEDENKVKQLPNKRWATVVDVEPFSAIYTVLASSAIMEKMSSIVYLYISLHDNGIKNVDVSKFLSVHHGYLKRINGQLSVYNCGHVTHSLIGRLRDRKLIERTTDGKWKTVNP
jgi:hypothetical protein